MKIEYIKIINFKLFADEEFSFNPQMNVIIGNNATGKTTILEALSYSLGTVLMGFLRYYCNNALSIYYTIKLRRR